jgi:hypothetical protein
MSGGKLPDPSADPRRICGRKKDPDPRSKTGAGENLKVSAMFVDDPLGDR